MKYTEVISRIYDSLAIVEYEKVNDDMILIHNIKSSSVSSLAELEALKDFVQEFKELVDYEGAAKMILDSERARRFEEICGKLPEDDKHILSYVMHLAEMGNIV